MPILTPRPLRIAIVTQGYFTGGGVPSVARWLARGLRTLGHQVDVHELGGHHPGETGWCEVEPRVRHWQPRVHGSEPLRFIPPPGLGAALDRYDIVQVVAGGPALALAVGGTATPLVLQVATRMPWERAALRSGTARQRALWAQAQVVGALEGRALRRACTVLVENPTMAAEADRLGAREVVQAPPGVDVSRFSPAAAGVVQDGPFLSVCRLWDPRKGLHRMISAYDAHVRATGDPRGLVLAGRGELHPDAADRLRSSGLADRVEVRQDVPLQRLPDLYRSASQFWQTSYEEGLGISTLEAMASGLPVVATRTAGSAECVRDGTTGRLVDQGGGDDAVVRAWSSAVSAVTARADALGVAGRARAVTEFSDQATLARYDQVYRRLVAAQEAST